MHPKLYYVPGLISLLLLFPLFYYTAEPRLHPPTTVSFFLPIDSAKDDFSFMFSVPYIEQCVQNKQQTKFWLGEEEADKKLSLQMIQQEALELKLTQDTNRVVAAVLLPTATFNDFVSLINICLISENKRYALARDTFYIFADPPPNTDEMICEGLIGEVIHVEEQPSEILEQMKKVFEEYAFPYWYWWCLYGALIWGTVFRLKRSN